MKKCVFFSILGISILFILGCKNCSKQAFCNNRVQPDYPEPFEIRMDSTEKARRETLPLMEQEQLEWREYEEVYLYKYYDVPSTFSLRESKIILDPNPMSKLKGYRLYKFLGEREYPFDRNLYPGLHIHGMTKEKVLSKYSKDSLIYTSIDTLRYGIPINHCINASKVMFMVSSIHYAEVSMCIWEYVQKGINIVRVVYFIRDGNVQRAFWGYEADIAKYMMDNPLKV